MKVSLWVLIGFLFAAAPTSAQHVRFEAGFAAMARITDGNVESTLFLRGARPLRPHWSPELTLGIEHRRKTATFVYSLALRKDWPRPGWIPFLRAGIGGETVIVGPYLETRPLFLIGAGGLFSLQKNVYLRIEYELQRVHAAAYTLYRHYFLAGIQITWQK